MIALNSCFKAHVCGVAHARVQAREWYREDLVGAALEAWLKDNAGSSPRESLFLTTKIHPRDFGPTTTLDVFINSLMDLRTTYLDLVLLHYPYCWGNLCGSIQPEGNWRDAWKALEELHAAGKVRAIGVSNFNIAEMRKLLDMAEVTPQVLQIHIDPLAQNRQVMKMAQEEGVQVEAYSALGTQWGRVGPDHHNPVLSHPVLQEIARELNRTVAQVVLRWLLHLNVAVIPRSTNPEHQREALLGVKEFELQPRHMTAISELDGTQVI
ncbi:NADP-dependent oxidoreductase domain-containing protein [Dunaliella salina]|uniref:NADP-dependent oxidoreductase domain-containing protein n=1 Tax=Dunaliella salina TaxID=3046 RepID=A0ABQ7HAF7_DUNSA|nr:NADP-dependent oxidoreductase domain-containing protein [Dunaliella salina]|eukprot:KAF5843839.1 NADP-dependent oxidoreductase domain-containing protein [Dunaliella salina]